MTITPELASDHMVVTEDDSGVTTVTFDNVGTGRKCGRSRNPQESAA